MARERLYGVKITAAVESLIGDRLGLAKDYYRRAAKKILEAGYVIEASSLRGIPPEESEELILSLAEAALVDDLAWLEGQAKYRRRLGTHLSLLKRRQPMVIRESTPRSDELPLETAPQAVQTAQPEREITLSRDIIITVARACGVCLDADQLRGKSGSLSWCARLLYDSMDHRSPKMSEWCACWVDLLLQLLRTAAARGFEPIHPVGHGMVSALRATIERVVTIWATLGGWRD